MSGPIQTFLTEPSPRDFFNDPDTDGKKGGREKAAILSVEGTNYSVDVFYAKEPCADYVKCCVDTVLKLHAVEPPGDMLVFLTGMDEVDHCVSLLKVNQFNLNQMSRPGVGLREFSGHAKQEQEENSHNLGNAFPRALQFMWGIGFIG